MLNVSEAVLGSETAVLWQDWSQTGLGLGIILLVLLPTLLCPTGTVWHDNAEM